MRLGDPRLRAQLAPARRELLGVLTTGVAGAVLVIAQAVAVAALVVAVVRGQPLALPVAAVAGVLALRGAVGGVGDLLAARAAAVVGTSLRQRLLGAALDGDAARAPAASGELATLITRGVASAEPYLTRYLPAVVLATVLPPLTVIAIASQDLLSAAIVLLTLPLVPVFGALVGLAARDRARAQWRALASLSGHFLDVMRGLPTLVAHRRARHQSARIAAVSDRYRRASLETLRLAFASSAVLELVATLSVALVAVTVGVRLADGGLDLSTALVVLLLAPEAYWPLRRVGAEFHAAAEGVATFEAAHELLGASGEPVAGPAPAPGSPLVLDDVSLVHPGRTVPAVAGLSAVLPAAGVTVVTGPSGCGKSTLLSALAGLTPPAAGTITAGGAPTAGRRWQEQVAWSPQRPPFVAGTIADNLALGGPPADEALWSALRRVALEERVRALPWALDTPLGEDGASLSAGERARLALARVVLAVDAGRTWVLLDEPTAHLDDVTEAVIVDTVAELGRVAAVVVVAHRPALLGIADRVLALPDPAGEVPGPAPQPVSEPVAALPQPEPVRASSAAPAPVASEDEPPAGRRGMALPTVLDALASASGVALTATAGWLIVQASTQPPVLTLLVAIVCVRAFGIARPALRYAGRVLSHDRALRLLARRRVEVYDAVVPLVPARLGRRRGEVLAAVVDDTDSVVDRELRVRLPLRSFLAVAVLATVLATAVLPLAGLVVGLAVAGSGVGGHLLARRGAQRAERRMVALRAELSAGVVDAVQLADALRMWQAAPSTIARVVAISRAMGASTQRGSLWLGAARAWVFTLTGCAMGLVALVASPAVSAGELSGPTAALLLLLPLALADVATAAADAGALSVRTRAAAARLAALERAAPAVHDPDDPRPAPASSATDVSNARARWEDAAPATEPVSLRLATGDRVAVVGPSGCGKSTLAAMLVRFLDPVSGEVALGGTPMRLLRLDDVRARVGLVDDDPHVFATTLVENVRLARPDADDAAVERALRRARLGRWLDTLPGGLHTWLGDGHAQVSGGERARIAVARSLLAEQEVLVLDEPAAHLDHATGTALARELLTGPREQSILWITHGDAGLELVDRVEDLAGPRTRPNPRTAEHGVGDLGHPPE